MAVAVRACPLCHTTTAGDYIVTDHYTTEHEPYRVVTCHQCGLRYTRPVPSVPEMVELYGEDYVPYQDDQATDARRRPLVNLQALVILFKRSLLWDRRRALGGRAPGRILDVGCGSGDFLVALKRRGWQTFGTEFSLAGGARAEAKGISVFQGNLVDARYEDGFFDVVTLWHVLEHLTEPMIELREAHRILRDDGLLVIEVPNIDCLTARLVRKKWRNLDVPRHLQHFSRTSLDHILDKAGFVTVRRQSFHIYDFTVDFYGLIDQTGLLKRFNIGLLGPEVHRLPLSKQLLLAIVLAPVYLLSLVYTIITTAVTGNGSTLTVTAKKRPTTP